MALAAPSSTAPVTASAGLHGSALTALLTQWGGVEPPATAPSFVDGLGRWLDWTDAIPLAQALGAPDGPPTAHGSALLEPERELERVRQGLLRAIADDGRARPRSAAVRAARVQIGAPRAEAPESGATTSSETDWLHFRHRYLGLQQRMADAISALRARLRATLAGHTSVAPSVDSSARAASLVRLAEIDAVLEHALAARIDAVLALLPARLERRYEQLQRAAAADDVGAWLATFRHDMQQLLQAELALRLQPLQGLLEALHPSSSQDA